MTADLFGLEQAKPRNHDRKEASVLEVLQAARDLQPHSNTQALIDRLVIVGYSALVQAHWEPPRQSGSDRESCKLPPDLRQHLPGEDG